MRYTWLPAVLVMPVLALAIGCSDPAQDASRKLSKETDEARRLYGQASTLLSNPVYIDKTSRQASPLLREQPLPSTQQVEVPTIQPIANEQAATLLDEAHKKVAGALAANREAYGGVKGTAELLLGEIELAQGRYHANLAEQHRVEADSARRKSQLTLEMARNNAVLADFMSTLAGLPKDKIAAIKDVTNKRVTAVNAKVKAINDEIAQKEQEITQLGQQNEELQKKASVLRDKSEKTPGTEGLKLLKECHGYEVTINANGGKIDQDKDRIDVLKVDRAILQQELTGAQAKLGAADRHLAGMTKSSTENAAAGKTILEEAQKVFGEAEAAASQTVAACKSAADEEAKALTLLSGAYTQLTKAETVIKGAVSAARAAASAKPSEPHEQAEQIEQNKSQDAHLASVLALNGDASLAMADLRSAQLITAAANAALAKRITDIGAVVKKTDVPVVAQLAEYQGNGADAKTKTQAAQDYTNAEKELDAVVNSNLKDQLGENVLWLYQGLLANAYYGHYRLSPTAELVSKAKEFVNLAATGRENSPYLASVMRLQRLMNPSEGAPSTPAPAPTSAPAAPAPSPAPAEQPE